MKVTITLTDAEADGDIGINMSHDKLPEGTNPKQARAASDAWACGLRMLQAAAEDAEEVKSVSVNGHSIPQSQ